jgi:hypothetical protein
MYVVYQPGGQLSGNVARKPEPEKKRTGEEPKHTNAKG